MERQREDGVEAVNGEGTRDGLGRDMGRDINIKSHFIGNMETYYCRSFLNKYTYMREIKIVTE